MEEEADTVLKTLYHEFLFMKFDSFWFTFESVMLPMIKGSPAFEINWNEYQIKVVKITWMQPSEFFVSILYSNTA